MERVLLLVIDIACTIDVRLMGILLLELNVGTLDLNLVGNFEFGISRLYSRQRFHFDTNVEAQFLPRCPQK